MNKYFALIIMSIACLLNELSANPISVGQSEWAALESVHYKSQCGQDRFVNEHFFRGKQNGVFVDIGAYDGVTISNTYFFEKELGWKGICIEPLPNAFERLVQNRQAICFNCAAGSYNGMTHFLQVDSKLFPELAMLSGEQKHLANESIIRIKELTQKYRGQINVIPVPILSLNELLLDCGFSAIDFLSMDVEGGELELLKHLDFDLFDIHVMAIENNQREADPRIRHLLESRGFKFFKRLEQDEIYVNPFFER